jgi:hypothetical protein
MQRKGQVLNQYSDWMLSLYRSIQVLDCGTLAGAQGLIVAGGGMGGMEGMM